MLLFWIKHREFFFAKIFSASLVLVVGIIFGLKNILKVARPEDALIVVDGYAMPSGHAGLSFFLATFFTYYFMRSKNLRLYSAKCRGLKIFLITSVFFVATIISASRIVLHVHTSTQVAVGAAIGILTPIILIFLRKKSKNI